MRVFWGVTSAVSAAFCHGRPAFMVKQGIEMTVLSSPGEQLDCLSRHGVATLQLVMKREISPIQDSESLFQLHRVLKQERPDLVEFGTPKAGFLGMLAARAAGVPGRLYTIHGLRLETTGGPTRAILYWTECIACLCATRILCVSESVRDKLVALKLAPRSKAFVLSRGSYTGVDTSHFTPANRGSESVARLRQRLGLSGYETVIGFVGRFVKDKGIRELVEAFRELSASRPELRLLLVGDFEGGDPVEGEVRRYIESNPAVLRPGFVSDTAPYYSLMDVFVLPTHREGFPGVPLEAQASEVPVITTNATGAVDSVRPGVTGLIVPVNDARALTRAIDSLLRNPGLRAEMGRAGRRWMQHDFRPEVIWQAHAEMYREMLAESRRVRRAGGLVKRVFDVVAAIGALIVLSPVMAAIALVVRIWLGSPVLFRQVRPGYEGRPFTCLKFRSMTDERDAGGELLPDAKRLTRLGQFLRSSSLDELPELVNVIRGEMSLVGPRPLLMQYLERYTPEQMRRHEVKPGITGWAQVNGRNQASWDEKFACDVWYVENRSVWLDLKILVLTLWKTIKREGICEPGQATMQEFRGATQAENGRV